jgi:FKBP-type peptidyl-prolyl cis-trans isomerase
MAGVHVIFPVTRQLWEVVMQKMPAVITVFTLLFFLAGAPLAEQGLIVMESGLKYEDLVVGSGAEAAVGKIAVIHLKGWLDGNGQRGAEFVDSKDRGKPVSFKIGTSHVMKAWNEGVPGMRVGGKRRLTVPSHLGYGPKGAGEHVPPNADLIIDVELLEVK